MNGFIKSLLSLLIFTGFSTGLSQAQTTGSVSLTATLSDTGSGPDHWTVVWVTNATTGAYVRTLRKQSNESRGSHWNQHCGSWYTAASLATSATNFSPALDGFTGATATTYSTPNSPFTQTWNCKDAAGTTVPDGTYRLWIQYAEDASGQGPVTTGGLLWTKGPAASTVNPTNQGTNFTNMSIVWTPSGVSTAPEIAVEQPVGTNIADAGSKAFGSVVVGSNSPLTFTIRNTGNANLTGLAITKDGTHAADFTVSSNPVAPVAGPSGTTTFIVTFAPSAIGTRSAAIHIANNDSDEAPFDINLTGSGTAGIEPPSIITHPASPGIVSGQTAILSAVATGSSPLYQWYRGISGDTASPISGANGSSFTTPALTAAATYWVRASNVAGVADSNTASVSISSYLLTTSAVHGTLTGAGVYGVTTQATLSATPDTGYVFSGWTGDASGTTNPLTVLMDSNKNIGATFSLDSANPTDPFVICFVGALFEPRVGNQITLDLKRLTGAGETVKLTSKLPAGLSYKSTTGLISGAITAKPGTYRVVVRILQGNTVVRTIDLPIMVLSFPDSLAGNYEGIIENTTGVPTGVFRISITSTNRWTATLESVNTKKRTAKGVCSLAPGLPVAQVSAVFPRSSGAPAVTVALAINGEAPNFIGTSAIGTLRGFRLSSTSDFLPSTVASNLVFDAGIQDGISVPAGFGWMKGNVNRSGSGSFSGMLGDGYPIRISLHLSSTGQAILWAQPYSNKQSFIGGIVSLGNLGQARSTHEKITETLWWSKAADAKTQSYPNGFPAMPISLGTSKWIVPSTAVELGASLGWRDNRTASVTIEGAGFENQNPQSPFVLPQEFKMDDTFNLQTSLSSSGDGGDDDSDDDDNDGRYNNKSSLFQVWSGKVSRTDGSFTGTIKIPAGAADGIAGGNAAVSGVLAQDESWGVVTGCGLVKVPIVGGKNLFRTAAIILEQ
jgi:uncharacterized repeat protein (TIGR02543 family)